MTADITHLGTNLCPLYRLLKYTTEFWDLNVVLGILFLDSNIMISACRIQIKLYANKHWFTGFRRRIGYKRIWDFLMYILWGKQEDSVILCKVSTADYESLCFRSYKQLIRYKELCYISSTNCCCVSKLKLIQYYPHYVFSLTIFLFVRITRHYFNYVKYLMLKVSFLRKVTHDGFM